MSKYRDKVICIRTEWIDEKNKPNHLDFWLPQDREKCSYFLSKTQLLEAAMIVRKVTLKTLTITNLE
jgi:hypothetical protein